MKVRLKFTHQSGTKEHDLKTGDIIAIGRSSKCDLQLGDERMSSQHCRINLNYDKLEVIDLDSKNGTYLNGIRVESSEVFIGDKIRVGATTITLEEESLDSDAIRVLTFPGPTRDRLTYELKADFTGARINNQSAEVNVRVNAEVSRVREVDIRKKIQSKIKLSKQEIRLQNKFKSILSLGIDFLCLLIILIFPIMAISRVMPPSATKNNILLICEALIAALFFLLNFKIAKFSIGENLSGIKTLYHNQ